MRFRAVQQGSVYGVMDVKNNRFAEFARTCYPYDGKRYQKAAIDLAVMRADELNNGVYSTKIWAWYSEPLPGDVTFLDFDEDESTTRFYSVKIGKCFGVLDLELRRFSKQASLPEAVAAFKLCRRHLKRYTGRWHEIPKGRVVFIGCKDPTKEPTVPEV